MKPIREHDGTNRRGLTVHCAVCGTPLIPTSEDEVCALCLLKVGAQIKTRLEKEFQRAREGKP